MRKILIINGHPDPESFNRAIALTYGEAAINNGADVQYLHLGDLQFDPNLRWGYRKRMELEPDLVDALDKIHWSEHQVWIHPVWWWSSPAVMKGFLDRVFLPGIVADYSEANEVVGLLGGRTARITADAPQHSLRLCLSSGSWPHSVLSATGHNARVSVPVAPLRSPYSPKTAVSPSCLS